MSMATEEVSIKDVSVVVRRVLEERSIHATVLPESDLRDIAAYVESLPGDLVQKK